MARTDGRRPRSRRHSQYVRRRRRTIAPEVEARHGWLAGWEKKRNEKLKDRSTLTRSELKVKLDLPTVSVLSALIVHGGPYGENTRALPPSFPSLFILREAEDMEYYGAS